MALASGEKAVLEVIVHVLGLIRKNADGACRDGSSLTCYLGKGRESEVL